MNIQFSVNPASGVSLPPQQSTIAVEVVYDRSTPAAEGERVGGIVTETVRLPLDQRLSGALLLQDAARPDFTVNVLAPDGSLAFSRVLKGDSGSAQLELSREDIERTFRVAQAIPNDQAEQTLIRSIKLVATGETAIDYARATVLVSPQRRGETGSEAGAFPLGLVPDRINAVSVSGQALDPLTKLTWINTHLAVDGTFSFALPVQDSTGWYWWLTGEKPVVGFVPDDLSVPSKKAASIALPPVQTVPTGLQGAKSQHCDCQHTIPVDVTEAELVNNPGVYTEDPGAFCRPFSNPERVLSEKSFSVIARATQPEISAVGSARTRSMRLLMLEDDDAFTPTPEPRSTFVSRLANIFRPAAVTAAANNAGLISKVPLRPKLPKPYLDLVQDLPLGRRTMNAQNPVQWEDDIAQYQATTVSLGHILEYRMRWRSNGYSLGTVVKTLSLAPRQVKRIQKIEWERSERARRTERTQLTDVENDSVTRQRDYQDEVSANLSEWAKGGSHSDTAAIAGGIGFFASGILGGVGGGVGSSNSSSHQEGGRSTNASEQQRLRDAIRRHGDALRKFESTVVNEVTQEETVTGTTEVIRNINYAHSLTVIYYQILRHLKVDTDFAGVRECLYVPFAIKPFTVHRAYRWRESIQSAIRSSRFLRALRYLKDVATGFSTSEIPPGSRSQQALTYLRGSIYLDMAIERPRDGNDGKYNDASWNTIRSLVDTPSYGIFSILAEYTDAHRDRVFQTNYAPGVAAKWCNRLRLRIGAAVINVDSTLATRYQFNKGVRVDFVVPLDQLSGLRRVDLQNVTVLPNDDLPPGSVANLNRMTITYSTARFERSVPARTGINDLVAPVSGMKGSALIQFPLDEWEAVNERLELTRTVNDLVEHLNEHVEYYHKAIWWRMDRDRLLMMLDGFYVPGTNNVSIASVVDREPVGVIGNSLVYRVGTASFLGFGEIKTPADLYNLFAEKKPVQESIYLSLPTDGLYAQTIMDECVALEEHFGNLDWALGDKDPDLGTIDPSLLLTRRADQSAGTTPTPFPSTIINLQNAPDAPAPSGLQGVLNAVTNPGAFRDMAGLAGTQASALAALNTAANLATNFGNQAAALELAKLAKSQEATKTADQKLATIQRSKDKGLTSEAEAAAQAKEVLSSMNPDTPKGLAPHENAAINSAIEEAKKVPGSTIEASTGEGAVKVTVGGSKEDSSGNPLIISLGVDGVARSFGPPSNMSGKTKLTVKGQNLPSGAQIKWSIPNSEVGKYTITQKITASGISEVEISGIRPGRAVIDVEALDSGVVIASMKLDLSIPQFITINDSNAAFDAFITGNLFQAVEARMMDEARKVIDRLLLKQANVRLVWASKGGVVPPHVLPAFVTTVVLGNTDPSGNYGSADARPGSVSGGDVGDTAFDEVVSIWPGNYLTSGSGSDVDLATNQLVQAVMSIQASDPEFEEWIIKIFGRLIGETMSHEIYHCLLPVPFVHTVDGAGNEINTGDMMDGGGHRTFLERTGIEPPTATFPPQELLGELRDHGIGSINSLTGVHVAHIRTHFPVPPTPPFN